MTQTAGTSTYFYHHDGLGSVVDITDASGKSLAWYEYYPYGLVRLAGADRKAPTNPIRFTGQQLDAVTGFYHLRARQYDPATGRFLTVDPAVPRHDQTAESLCVYASNRPVNLVDPRGFASTAPKAIEVGPLPAPAPDAMSSEEAAQLNEARERRAIDDCHAAWIAAYGLNVAGESLGGLGIFLHQQAGGQPHARAIAGGLELAGAALAVVAVVWATLRCQA